MNLSVPKPCSIVRWTGERLTKDAVIQCRVEPTHIDKLKQLAEAKGVSVSALTRKWLLERLQKEKSA